MTRSPRSRPRLAALVAAPALLLSFPAPAARAASWDLATVQAVNKGLASPVADDVATFLTTPAVTAGAVALVAAGGNQHAYQAAVTGLAAEVVGLGAAEGFKDLINRPRPYVLDPTLRTPAGREPDSSFPSGHTTVAFAGAMVVALDEPQLAPWGYAFATLVGLSRIYEGVHYPTDVLAGAALGSLAGWGAVAGREYLQGRGWLPAPAREAAGDAAPGIDGLTPYPLALAWRF